MYYFVSKLIRRYVSDNRYRRLCEVGVCHGEAADALLGLRPPVDLSLIDPCLDADLCGKYSGIPNVHVFKGLSLEILPRLDHGFDCIMLDGDHNWYTVINELRMISGRGLLAAGGTIFLHDVCWPYARRDMYYMPNSIPPEFRQPYARKGILKGKSALVDDGGKNSHLLNALHEGGTSNGVLTAAEDFLKENKGKFFFIRVRMEYGLGILISKKDMGTWFMVARWYLLVRVWEFLAWAHRLLRRVVQK